MILGNKILLENKVVSGSTNLNDSLISLWEFDEPSGTLTSDSVGANDGTSFNTTITTGVLSNALNYGGDGHVTIPESTSMNLNANADNFSISMWVKSPDPALTASNVRLIERRLNSGGPYAYSWQIIAATGEVWLACYDGTNFPIAKMDGWDVWDNQWHLITQVVNQTDNTVEGWLDGQFYTSVINTTTTATNSISTTKIGANVLATVFYSGLIDQVGMWHRVLTLQDHTDLYNSGAGLAYTSW